MNAYSAGSSTLAPVRRALPPPAFLEFLDAANSAASSGLQHNDCIKFAWEDIKKRWERPEGKQHWSRRKEFRRMKGFEKKGFKIFKVDEELRMAFGWASVITEKDKPVIDSQGHVIKADVLLTATTEFMMDVRKAKEMHEGGAVGEVVHSFPLTAEISKALDIDLHGREGWIVGVYVKDDDVWELVKSGDYPAFSIGGEAVLEDYEEEAA